MSKKEYVCGECGRAFGELEGLLDHHCDGERRGEEEDD